MGLFSRSTSRTFSTVVRSRGPSFLPGRSSLRSRTKRTPAFLVEPLNSKLYSKGLPSQPTAAGREPGSGLPPSWGQMVFR